MSGDDKFDEFLRREAAAYNRPREVPRDAMWEAIQARRGRGAEGNAPGAPLSAPGSNAAGSREAGPRTAGSSAAGASRRVLTFPMMRRWGLAAAAVLLIAFGIAIGRVLPSKDAVVQVADDAPPVRVPPGPGAPPTEQQMATNAAARPDAQPDVESREPSTVRPRERRVQSPSPAAPSQQLASVEPGAASREPRAQSLPSGPAAAPAYQQVMQQHLARTEQLLVAFRSDARDGRIEADMSRFARTLLSSTRLLLDSPAGDDPRRRRLLEDLELVLVQIVHLAPDAPAEERDDVGRAIEQGDVLSRLRNTVPAGVVSSGT